MTRLEIALPVRFRLPPLAVCWTLGFFNERNPVALEELIGDLAKAERDELLVIRDDLGKKLAIVDAVLAGQQMTTATVTITEGLDLPAAPPKRGPGRPRGGTGRKNAAAGVAQREAHAAAREYAAAHGVSHAEARRLLKQRRLAAGGGDVTHGGGEAGSQVENGELVGAGA